MQLLGKEYTRNYNSFYTLLTAILWMFDMAIFVSQNFTTVARGAQIWQGANLCSKTLGIFVSPSEQRLTSGPSAILAPAKSFQHPRTLYLHL